MLFDTPQWPILPAQTPEKWGNTHNSVKICPVRGKEYSVLITVPTQLHGVLREVLRVQPDDTVWLFLEETETDGWYLHLEWKHGSLPFADLWRYPKMPHWAEKQYALPG